MVAVVGVIDEGWRRPVAPCQGIERKGGVDPSQREESERGRRPALRRWWPASSTKGGSVRR
jgi:hypothetical protein